MKKKNMKKLLLIVMLFFAMGWAGCPHDRYGRDDRRDNDRYERDGRDNHEHGRNTEYHR